MELDRGNHGDASDVAERYLRTVPPGIPLQRLDGLVALALARLRLGDLDGARGSVSELAGIAETLGTEAAQASAAFTRGIAAVASGDLERARRLLEDSVDLFQRARGVQESNRARLQLAGVLAELGRRGVAALEAKMALTALSELGAAADVAVAEELLKGLGSTARPRTEGGAIGPSSGTSRTSTRRSAPHGMV